MLLPLEIRDATPSEIRTAIAEAQDKVRKINHIAWVADIAIIDQFRLDGSNERLFGALTSLFSITEALARDAETTLGDCL